MAQLVRESYPLGAPDDTRSDRHLTHGQGSYNPFQLAAPQFPTQLPNIARPSVESESAKFDVPNTGRINVDRATLQHMSQQALAPYKETHINGFMRRPDLSSHAATTFHRGHDYVVAIDDKHGGGPGSVDINMGDMGRSHGVQEVAEVVERIHQQDPSAKVMTTGSTIGSNVMNAHQSTQMQRAVERSTDWAGNR